MPLNVGDTDPNLITTLPETPSSKASAAVAQAAAPPQPKPEMAKSEMWTTLLTLVGVLASGLSLPTAADKFVTLASVIITGGVYAYFRTSLPSEHSGWKTRAFLSAALTIVGSIALTLSQADLPFLPKGVTADASLVAAAISAAGYSVYRYRAKVVAKK